MAEPLLVPVWLSPAGSVPRSLRVPVRLYASRRGATVLWESPSVAVIPDGPDRVWVVLGDAEPLPPEVGAAPLRFLAVGLGPDAWSPRAVVDCRPLRAAARLATLDARIAVLEQVVVHRHLAEAVAGLRDVLDDHERRVTGLEQTHALEALEARAAQLAGRLDREGGRLVRIEDELEDLVGPQGDVVDFEARLSRLERALQPERSPDAASKHPSTS